MKKTYDYMIPIGKYCERIRRKLGLTQEEIGKMCGHTRQYISYFERGEARSIKIYNTYLELEKQCKEGGSYESFDSL